MTIEKLLDGFRGSASPPTIYLRLNDEINRSDSSLRTVGEIISEDANLSARLLRLVNSAFYGFPRRIETVSEAVFLVGGRQVRDLALVTTLMDTFSGIDPRLVDGEKFWLHSLACGTGCKLIAALLGKQDLERFFLSGVMHDIGRIVLFSSIPIQSEVLLRRAVTEQRSLTDIEHEVFGYTHALVGQALAERWRLPAYLQEVIRYHHTPEKAQVFPDIAGVVHVADVLTHSLMLGSSGEPFVPVLNHATWDRLGISKYQLPQLMESIEQETNAIAWMPSAAPKGVEHV